MTSDRDLTQTANRDSIILNTTDDSAVAVSELRPYNPKCHYMPFLLHFHLNTKKVHDGFSEI